jgi:hypothetical protein
MHCTGAEGEALCITGYRVEYRVHGRVQGIGYGYRVWVWMGRTYIMYVSDIRINYACHTYGVKRPL